MCLAYNLLFPPKDIEHVCCLLTVMCLLRKYHTSTFSHRTSLTRICSYENEDGEGVRAVVGVGSKGGDQLRICLGGCWGKRGNGTRRE